MVVPSNVDIATTEALSMAQEEDPDGDRTIGERWGADRGNTSLESRGEAGWSAQGRDLRVTQEPLRCRSGAHQGWGMWATMDPSWRPPGP